MRVILRTARVERFIVGNTRNPPERHDDDWLALVGTVGTTVQTLRADIACRHRSTPRRVPPFVDHAATAALGGDFRRRRTSPAATSNRCWLLPARP